MRMDNKVALITGAAAGIGKATALLFANEGASVIIADINEDRGSETAQVIKKNGGSATFVKTDIGKTEDCRNACEIAARTYGKLDVLVNNAATYVLKGVFEATDEDWQRSINVNIIGTARMSHFAAEKIKLNEQGGAIVNLGSISSYVAQPNFVTYSTTKGAIVQMTRNLAMDLAKFKIRVNAICPGTIITEATYFHLANVGMTMEDFLTEENSKHLLNRVGQPDEVARAILFLASDEASFITGTSLMVDGGYTAK